MRKLATLQKILEINPIEGADSIEVATILGWKVVVAKSENFQVGDLVIYCEIDSVFPEKPEFEFLRSKKFRIKTIRLRGQISQGIVFPLSLLENNLFSFEKVEGFDVTGELEITKYEPPVPGSLQGVAKGNFPSFIPKTDETRVQGLYRTLKENEGKSFYITQKLDGTSFTAYYKAERDEDGHPETERVGVCSRNWELELSDSNDYISMFTELNLGNKLGIFEWDIAIQGELVGPGIQKNPLKLEKKQLFVFDIFLIDEQRYMSLEEMEKFCSTWELNMVPVIEKDFKMITSIDDIVNMSISKSVLNPQVWTEGLVFRLNDDSKLGRYDRVSFKAINPEYLLKYDN